MNGEVQAEVSEVREGAGVPDVVRARPRRLRVVCWVAAAAVVVVFTLIGTALRGSIGEGRGAFGVGDQIAMVILGLVFAAGILTFTRAKVEADRDVIRVTNIIGGYTLPWSLVRAVRFDHRTPWVTLDLVDDDTVSVFAVQANDREYAVATVRGLRALLAQNRAARVAAQNTGPSADAAPSNPTTDPSASEPGGSADRVAEGESTVPDDAGPAAPRDEGQGQRT